MNQLLLKMRMGYSFRDSFLQVNSTQPEHFKEIMEQIYKFVAFSQQKKPNSPFEFLNFIMNELKSIDQQGHLAIKRLEVLRFTLKTQSDFRHRSGQVTLQIKAQAVVVTVLYIALTLFVSLQFGLKENFDLILLSFFLFVIGLWGVFKIGKDIKWKT